MRSRTMPISTRDLLKEFSFKVAVGPDIGPAVNLFRQVYEADVGFVPSDGMDDSATYLIAKCTDGDVAATLRFLGPEHRPFVFEKSCEVALPDGSRPALLSRFSVSPLFRAAPRSIALHFGMLKLAVEFALPLGVTDLLQYTQPHLINFYRAAFFEATGVTFELPPLQSKMHVLRLNLRTLDERCRASNSRGAEFLRSPDRIVTP
ncbi:MAG: hypothetical protein SF182_17060 [Deltaproteobacteria bacterium]|nr:hypothetical protein [Deltaproteobacteria bacterium]